MLKLETLNDFVLVEKYDKVRKKTDASPFTSVVTSTNLGTVKYSSRPEFPAGTMVYFSAKYEVMFVEGVEVLAINVKDIVAKVTDTAPVQGA